MIRYFIPQFTWSFAFEDKTNGTGNPLEGYGNGYNFVLTQGDGCGHGYGYLYGIRIGDGESYSRLASHRRFLFEAP